MRRLAIMALRQTIRLATGIGRLFAPLAALDIWDLAVIGGAWLFCAGVSEIYPPAARMAGGAIIAALAWWWAPAGGRKGGG